MRTKVSVLMSTKCDSSDEHNCDSLDEHKYHSSEDMKLSNEELVQGYTIFTEPIDTMNEQIVFFNKKYLFDKNIL